MSAHNWHWEDTVQVYDTAPSEGGPGIKWGVFEHCPCQICGGIQPVVVAPVNSFGAQCPFCGHVDVWHWWSADDAAQDSEE